MDKVNKLFDGDCIAHAYQTADGILRANRAFDRDSLRATCMLFSKTRRGTDVRRYTEKGKS